MIYQTAVFLFFFYFSSFFSFVAVVQVWTLPWIERCNFILETCCLQLNLCVPCWRPLQVLQSILKTVWVHLLPSPPTNLTSCWWICLSQRFPNLVGAGDEAKASSHRSRLRRGALLYPKAALHVIGRVDPVFAVFVVFVIHGGYHKVTMENIISDTYTFIRTTRSNSLGTHSLEEK